MTTNNTERTRLIGFLKVVTDHLARQGASIQAFEDLLSGSRLDGYPISGIRQATNDFIEWASEFSDEALEDLDKDLSTRGLPTMSAMRDRSYRKAQATISRGLILNDTEWYLLNGLISKVDCSPLSEEEKAMAEDLVGNYTPVQADEAK